MKRTRAAAAGEPQGRLAVPRDLEETVSLRTPLCNLLGIDVPIICAPFGPWEQVSAVLLM
jgi:hypothetical protein